MHETSVKPQNMKMILGFFSQSDAVLMASNLEIPQKTERMGKRMADELQGELPFFLKREKRKT